MRTCFEYQESMVFANRYSNPKFINHYMTVRNLFSLIKPFVKCSHWSFMIYHQRLYVIVTRVNHYFHPFLFHFCYFHEFLHCPHHLSFLIQVTSSYQGIWSLQLKTFDLRNSYLIQIHSIKSHCFAYHSYLSNSS